MSISISNGYRIQTTSLFALRQTLLELREQIQPVCLDRYAGRCAEACVALLDTKALKGESALRSRVLWDYGLRHQSERDAPMVVYGVRSAHGLGFDISTSRRRTHRLQPHLFRDSDWDFRCEASVMPAGGSSLAMIWTAQEAYYKVFDAHPSLEPYPYWNNTDHPDELSEADWEARRVDWDMALPSGIPANDGLSFTLATPPMYPEVETLVAAQPAFEQRIEDFAKDRAFSRGVAALGLDVTEPHVITSALQILDSDVYRDYLAEERKAVGQVLPPRYTESDFTADLIDMKPTGE